MRALSFKQLFAICIGVACSISFLYGQTPDQRVIDSVRSQFLFEQGMIALHTDKPTLAYYLLSSSFNYSPSGAAAHALAELTQGRMSDRSYEWGRKAFDLSPSEQRYMQTYVNELLQKQDWKAAIEVLERYRKYAPTEVEAAMLLTEIYIVDEKPDKAKKLFDEMRPLMIDTPYEEVMHQIRFKILQAMGADLKEVRLYAEDLLKSQLRANPEKAMSGVSYLLSMGDAEGVREIVNRLPEAERNLPSSRVLVTTSFMIEGRRTEASHEILQLLASGQLTPDEALVTLLPLLQRETQKGVLPREYNTVFEALLALHRDNYDLHASYVAQLYGQGDNDGALKYLYKLSQLFPKEHPEIWSALIEERLMEGDFSAAERFIDEGLQQYPKEPSLIVYRGLIRMAQEKYTSAKELFLQALQFTPAEEHTVRAEIFSHLGDLYYAQNSSQEAFDYYEKALADNPKQINVLNNYAYYLATEGGNLEKAARMAAKAVELQPEMPYILDTYGYILYLQKNYTLAEIYLRKAIENSVDNPDSRVTYLLHYTAVLEALGKVAEAIELLQKELQTNPNEEITVRIEYLKSLKK
ncbi:tetratricopeptide repeat protein [Porphyromonas circumdentaria]|uniref:Tetratricopeptide repeat-containing protein n=1 Tax=Porphyromonas circumdentaria TaxID=29524 RepID=A0A1T4MMT3_9PORP|nr:tetratricopeptide repeat protein [Porphyromonas circumdentaria]MBB6275881.1 tetratricopeptide (TPR) repeat protein [Porphyromonas circumdentaria]SJZ68263.1 Tetratricopeptide repeat-containing protein [Porphyromonas circumdentaria]